MTDKEDNGVRRVSVKMSVVLPEKDILSVKTTESHDTSVNTA